MKGYLSFRTTDSDNPADWSKTGHDIQKTLAKALEHRGFSVNLAACQDEPDWCFHAARGPAEVFAVALVLANISPCRWWIGLEDTQHKPLASSVLREEVTAILEDVIISLPGASEVRWHPDWTTLRGLSNDPPKHVTERSSGTSGFLHRLARQLRR